MLGQDDIMHGRVKGLESFTSSIKQILAVMPSNKDQMALISSLFNVWEENILSLGEGLQEDLGMYSITTFCCLIPGIAPWSSVVGFALWA